MTRGDDHRLADILTAAPSTDVASATITGAQLSSTHTMTPSASVGKTRERFGLMQPEEPPSG